MVSVNLYGLMDLIMKDNIEMIKNMEVENYLINMENY